MIMTTESAEGRELFALIKSKLQLPEKAVGETIRVRCEFHAEAVEATPPIVSGA